MVTGNADFMWPDIRKNVSFCKILGSVRMPDPPTQHRGITLCFLVVLEEIEKRNAEQSMETAEIKATVKSLDRERDDLQQQVDEKTEEVMDLEAKKIHLVGLHLLLQGVKNSSSR